MKKLLFLFLFASTITHPVLVKKAAPPDVPYDLYDCKVGTLERRTMGPTGAEMWAQVSGPVDEIEMTTHHYRCEVK